MIAIQPQTTYALTVPPGPLTAAELRELVTLGAGLLGLTLTETSYGFTPAMDAQLGAMFAGEHTFTEIGAVLGVSAQRARGRLRMLQHETARDAVLPDGAGTPLTAPLSDVKSVKPLPVVPPVPTPLCALTKADRQAIRTMRQGGMTTHAIAETLGRELVDVNAQVTREVMGATGGAA